MKPKANLITSNHGLLLAPCLLLAGCDTTLWGNLGVLVVTVGIFFGTLSLGRHAEPSSAEASASRSTRGI